MRTSELIQRFTKVKLALPVGKVMVPQEPVETDDADFIPHLTFDWTLWVAKTTVAAMARRAWSFAAL